MKFNAKGTTWKKFKVGIRTYFEMADNENAIYHIITCVMQLKSCFEEGVQTLHIYTGKEVRLKITEPSSQPKKFKEEQDIKTRKIETGHNKAQTLQRQKNQESPKLLCLKGLQT